MTFETNSEVLEWYERQPRTLTPEFIDGIDWKDVKNYEISEKLLPVIFYMRDVESLTDVYYEEMRRTPTGKDPVISKFMERWSAEEQMHGELLNRFLEEAGIPVEEKWQKKVKSDIPFSYTLNTHLVGFIAGLIGRRFTATHMTFGAIHEMSTGQGYRRMINLAQHPVLTQILNGIIREESAHTQFYSSVARLELKHSEFTQKIARFVVKNFWTPVGQGSKRKAETEYTIGTLFSGEQGMDWTDRNVTGRVQNFPGFGGFTKVSDKIGSIAEAHTQMETA